jgi:dimethylhistidine N-methyltransferase
MQYATLRAEGENEAQFATARDQARADLIAGLAKPQASIAPKYFYDAQGSKLFEAICALDEYYPTRSEHEIFRLHGPAIAEAVGQGTVLIDLGAGNCEKAASLLEILHPRMYVPVDISVGFLYKSVAPLCQAFPGLAIHPVGTDFSESLILPAFLQAQPHKLFFYPGSSLGNFGPLQAVRFLRNIREHGGDLLIGLDLVKDITVLEAAYDDALGVTAAFNLNSLRHVNQILSTDFDLADWSHHAFFNTAQSRIEMHLRALRACRVTWPGGIRNFAAGETNHTENSYKFTLESATELLQRAGFTQIMSWTDPLQNFLVCHARTD